MQNWKYASMGVRTHVGQEVSLLSLPDFNRKTKVAGNLGVSYSAGQQAQGLKASSHAIGPSPRLISSSLMCRGEGKGGEEREAISQSDPKGLMILSWSSPGV